MTDALRRNVAQFLGDANGHFNLPNGGNTNQGNNPGLALARYLRVQSRDDRSARNDLLAQVAERGEVSPHYRRAYERWKATTTGMPGVVTKREPFRVQVRMIVGYGAESVLEASIALNQPWGMPYIPGSALKGLAAHYLQGVLADGDANLMRAPDPPPGTPPHVRIPPNAHGVLFGSQRDAAYITWHDAWLVPDSPESKKPLCLDVITVHHLGYYQERAGLAEPTDFDDPIPISFLSARGDYLICLQGPDQAWVEFAYGVLTQALEHAGIGAKTAAGYGRLKPAPSP